VDTFTNDLQIATSSSGEKLLVLLSLPAPVFDFFSGGVEAKENLAFVVVLMLDMAEDFVPVAFVVV
jgi:hypothetical protein